MFKRAPGFDPRGLGQREHDKSAEGGNLEVYLDLRKVGCVLLDSPAGALLVPGEVHLNDYEKICRVTMTHVREPRDQSWKVAIGRTCLVIPCYEQLCYVGWMVPGNKLLSKMTHMKFLYDNLYAADATMHVLSPEQIFDPSLKPYEKSVGQQDVFFRLSPCCKHEQEATLTLCGHCGNAFLSLSKDRQLWCAAYGWEFKTEDNANE